LLFFDCSDFRSFRRIRVGQRLSAIGCSDHFAILVSTRGTVPGQTGLGLRPDSSSASSSAEPHKIVQTPINDESWLGWAGYVHSWDMTVTERTRREGNVIHWEATVYDPTMLLEPWTLDPVRMRLNDDPEAFFFDITPCEERDAEHMVEPNGRG